LIVFLKTFRQNVPDSSTSDKKRALIGESTAFLRYISDRAIARISCYSDRLPSNR